MLRIVTFLYGQKYTDEHARRLFRGLSRNLHMDWEPVLITDRDPRKIDMYSGVRVIPLWDELRDTRNCGVRLKAFDESMRDLIGPRFAWVDLDLVPVRDATEFFSRKEDFVICKTPRPPLFYNGSIVLMDAGARSRLYTEYTAEAYVRLGKAYGTVSDEGWIGAKLGGDEATWDMSHGLYYYRNHIEPAGGKLPDDAVIVLMNGRRYDPANRELQRKSPWIAEHWR